VNQSIASQVRPVKTWANCVKKWRNLSSIQLKSISSYQFEMIKKQNIFQ